VDSKDLEANVGYIQITSVEPHVNLADLPPHRRTEYWKQNSFSEFSFNQQLKTRKKF
jgi:hypothetical protein